MTGIADKIEIYYAKKLTHQVEVNILDSYRESKKRILFLDYDGTLVPFAKTPEEAIPDNRLLKLLRLLSSNPKVNVVIISGRNRSNLEEWYGKYNITLVAEHGVWIKKPGNEWKLIKQLKNDWKKKIIQILEMYKQRLPKSFIEEKEYSVVWHFRNSDSSLSELRVKEFVDDMVYFTARNEIEVLMGSKVVEIKCSGINKGEAAKMLLLDQNYDFIMAAGDDETDEYIFQNLPKGSFSIKIGRQKSYADYYLNSSSELLRILEEIIGYKKEFIKNIFDLFKKI